MQAFFLFFLLTPYFTHCLNTMRSEKGMREEEEKVVPEEGIEPPTKGL
jgi:hypothetical protein